MTLHMLQMGLDSRALARFQHSRGIPGEDEGYLLHRALRECFGATAPQPFRLLAGTRDAPPRLLGYAAHDHAPLVEALAVQPPDLDALFQRPESKPMPTTFRSAATYGFELRACPIVRTRRSDGPGTRELDVFLHRSLAVPGEAPVSREAVYVDWLSAQLATGGAEAIAARLHRYDQMPVVRRGHGDGEAARPRRLFELRDGRRIMARRPDIVFRGNLRITDPDRFAALLARGVGRHRAFGFGMLLLRPARPG